MIGCLRRFIDRHKRKFMSNTNTVELYNFDHGFSRPTKFKIDCFEIEILEHHIENLSKITRNGRYDTITGKDIEESKIGEILPTALLIMSDGMHEESILYNVPGRKFVDDFVLCLYFLTGRKVFLEEDIISYSISYYTYPIVSKNFFCSSSNKAMLQNFDLKGKFEALKLSKNNESFYHLIQAKTYPDAVVVGLYANIIFDAISNTWCRENQSNRYTDKQKDALKHLEAEFKKNAKEYLTSEGFDETFQIEVINRIKTPMQPSALFSQEVFLKSLNIYSGEKDAKARLQIINALRNKLIHSGEIKKKCKNQNLYTDLDISIFGNFIFILLDICDLYFLKEYFKIEHEAEKIKSELITYFRKGTYKDVRVFDETFDEYINDLKIKQSMDLQE